MGVVSSPSSVSRIALCGALLAAAANATANETITYTYDARGQVVAVDRAGTVNNGQTVDVTYDKAGNRINYTSGGAVTTAELSIDDVSVTEGGNLVFTVTRSGLLTSAVTVDYVTSDDTAIAGTDYTTASASLSFAANETTKTITVATIDDSDIESAKAMTVTLSNAVGADLVTATGTGTINDNDTPPGISIADATATEGGTLNFVVSLAYASLGTVTVDYATSDGAAIAGSDYTAASGTVTFDPSETTKTVTVATIDDSVSEPTEMFALALSAPVGATIAAGSATGTITDNEAATWFTIQNLNVVEGQPSDFDLIVTRSGVTSTAVSVNYATQDGTAVAGQDYVAKTGTISFSAGQVSKTFEIKDIDDQVPEPDEEFSVILSNPSAGTAVAQGTGVVTIQDNNDPGFTISDASSFEGSALVFTVTRLGRLGSPNSVQYATSSGTATSGTDFTAKSGNLNFSPNETSKTISVTTTSDSGVEDDETVLMSLSNPQSGTVMNSPGTGTILDDDEGSMAYLAVGNATVTEGGTLTFPVTRTGNTAIAVSAAYTTSNGTAVAPGDYTAKSGTVSLGANQTSGSITVTTINDSSTESDETVTMTLSSPSSGAALSNATSTGTINDNDAPASTVSIADASATEGDDLDFVVTRTGSTSGAMTISYNTASGTATASDDYYGTSSTFTLNSGQSSGTISIGTKENTTAESTETMGLVINQVPSGVTLADGNAVGTIYDDDGGSGVSVAIADASATEGDNLNFVVTRTGSTSSAITISYNTASGTATTSNDYYGVSSTLTLNSGQSSATISIGTKENTTAESTETMSLVIWQVPAGVTLTDGTAVGTIYDDD